MLSVKYIVATHPFFADFPASYQAEMVHGAHVLHFDSNVFIFRAGQAADHLYLIGQGRVALESAILEGTPVSIQTLGEGEILGWSWFFPPYTWHFDARTLAPTQVIAFDAAHLRALCAANEALCEKMTHCMRHILASRRTAVERDTVVEMQWQ